MTSAYVFDVTAPDFEAKVVAKSKEVPVLLDFWAAWCGPCRTLGPVLEKLAEEYSGGFLLGKVDTEAEQDLAYAFQVQGIPMCVLMSDGRPVDAFSGAVPEAEVRRFLETHGVRPAAAESAEQEEDLDSPEARFRAGLAAAARGDVDAARERLGGITDEDALHGAAQRVVEGLTASTAAVDGGAGPAAAAIVAGRARLAAGDFEGAAEAMLESIAADTGFGGGMARKTILLCFELMALEPGDEDRLASFRRRLATLLF